MDCPDTPTAAELRFRLIVDTAFEIIRFDEELRFCEGLRLIEATRRSIAQLDPAMADRFEDDCAREMRRALMERFGIDPEGPREAN